ncbi:alpha/beta hydrolase protein [Auriscalpium vulgare]|uniref:Alpha/beta hydrolase protein n=1 Tax=Auriscalpium vulgare TaxID=40419 RepID=A0ACB8RYI0_9AGAM|nr:alpha/beta hydrolase protein [Auriscalpium vulgare]
MAEAWGLPAPISSGTLRINDLAMHYLYAGKPESPLVLLLHGFPELSFSWRSVLPLLAEAGFFVVAPDQRGYGPTVSVSRNAPGPVKYDEDPAPYRMFNLVRDVVALVYALGYEKVHAIVGHDFGSMVAGFSALIRPDLFTRVVMMSAPFTGAPAYPTPKKPSLPNTVTLINYIRGALAELQPPRKLYQLYFTSPAANVDMHTRMNNPEDLRTFLRAYFHVKSADWASNDPHPLPALTASALAVVPEYYIMDMARTMPETVLPHAPAQGESRWLPDAELAVYGAEFTRTGFQGGLNWYRCMADETATAELLMFAGKRVEVPAMFVAGRKDWGVWQAPGAVEKMKEVCPRMGARFHLIEGAGHWVQMEQPLDLQPSSS